MENDVNDLEGSSYRESTVLSVLLIGYFWLSHVEFSCVIEGPFSRLILIHVAPLMNQIKLSRSRLLCSVDVLTFKRARIFGLSFMIRTAA